MKTINKFLIGFVILSLLDIITTKYALLNSNIIESNPVMNQVVHNTTLFIFVKIIGIILIYNIISKIYTTNIKWAHIGMKTISIMMLFVVLNNIYVITGSATNYSFDETELFTGGGTDTRGSNKNFGIGAGNTGNTYSSAISNISYDFTSIKIISSIMSAGALPYCTSGSGCSYDGASSWGVNTVQGAHTGNIVKSSNVSNIVTKHVPFTASVNGQYYGRGGIGWQKSPANPSSNMFYYYILFDEVDQLYANTLTGTQVIEFSYDKTVYTNYWSHNVLCTFGCGQFATATGISIRLDSGKLTAGETIIEYSYYSQIHMTFEVITSTFGYFNVTKNNSNFNTTLSNLDGDIIDQQQNTNDFSTYTNYLDGLSIHVIDIASSDSFTKTVMKKPELVAQCPTGEPASSSNGWGWNCYNKYSYAVDTEPQFLDYAIYENGTGTLYNYSISFYEQNKTTPYRVIYIDPVMLSVDNISSLILPALTKVGTYKTTFKKHSLQDYNTFLDSFSAYINVYDPALPAMANIKFNNTFNSFNNSVPVNYNITYMDDRYGYFVFLWDSTNGNILESRDISGTSPTGTIIYDKSIFDQENSISLYLYLKEIRDYDPKNDRVLSSDNGFYGNYQTYLNTTKTGNFTITNTNKEVKQGDYLNVTYNLSIDGFFTKGYNEKYNVGAGSSISIKMYIPENSPLGNDVLRLKYRNSLLNSDVTIYSETYTIIPKSAYFIKADKTSYYQGDYIKFKAYNDTDGSYARIFNPDGEIVYELDFMYGNRNYDVSYQTTTDDPIGTYTASLYALDGSILANATTYLNRGAVSVTPTPNPNDLDGDGIDDTTGEPVIKPNTATGDISSECVVSGGSLMDIGGVLGCVTFGKIQTDANGDIADTQQNRNIWMNGLYTLMFLCLIIFVGGTYKKLRR